MFNDAQATEKHILREHPDQTYNQFICLICDKVKASPQQILDHLGQSVEKGGHCIKNRVEKEDHIRAVHRETQEQLRVFRENVNFSWLICLPCRPFELSSTSEVASNPFLHSSHSKTTIQEEHMEQEVDSGNQQLDSVVLTSSSAVRNQPPKHPAPNVELSFPKRDIAAQVCALKAL